MSVCRALSRDTPSLSSVALGAGILDPLGLAHDVLHQLGMAIGEVRAERVERGVGERLELAVAALIRQGCSVPMSWR